MARAIELILATSAANRTALVVRVAAGAVFVVFGIGKFSAHASEAEAFARYGLPSPGTFASAIGVLEIVGGALLLAGAGARVAALALAGDMVGAIVASGIGEGEVISLTLAPLLLVGMTVLLATGAGAHSVDARLLERAPPGSDASPGRLRT
jgi:putative oxidoreductase